MMYKYKNRQSGLECLKLFAIAIIILSHIVQCMTQPTEFAGNQPYLFSISSPSKSVSVFTLALFFHLGSLGNDIFFISSAWFLLESRTWKKEKWMRLFLQTWVISVLCLLAVLLIRHGQVPGKLILHSILPNLFTNTWYITAYLLFYPLAPLLNVLIANMDRRRHFQLAAVMTWLYLICEFIVKGAFFSSKIIQWVAIYLLLSYLKKYKRAWMDDRKMNLICLLIGLAGFILLPAISNVVGLLTGRDTNLLYWVSNANPFLVLIAIASVNLVRRNENFHNGILNYLSSLSLTIYLLQSNLMFKTYYRTGLVRFFYNHFGFENAVVGKAVVMAGIVFAVSLIGAILYDRILSPAVKHLSRQALTWIRRIYHRAERSLS